MLRRFDTIVFDLDGTLMDTWEQLVKPALDQAFEQMIQHGLPAAKNDVWRYVRELEQQPLRRSREDVIRRVADEFCFDEDERINLFEIGFQVFHECSVPDNIRAFPMCQNQLHELIGRGYELFLVSMGHPLVQRRKLKQLKLGCFFRKSFFIDPIEGGRKRDALLSILQMTGKDPSRILVIGDRIDREISEANELGMQTCRIKSPGYANWSPQSDLEKPDFELKHFGDLVNKCQL
jgi:FMN phosphatase YigB (HAD superfamily)